MTDTAAQSHLQQDRQAVLWKLDRLWEPTTCPPGTNAWWAADRDRLERPAREAAGH